MSQCILSVAERAAPDMLKSHMINYKTCMAMAVPFIIPKDYSEFHNDKKLPVNLHSVWCYYNMLFEIYSLGVIRSHALISLVS